MGNYNSSWIPDIEYDNLFICRQHCHRFVLSDVQYKKAGRWLVKHTATIEIEGKDKPAAIVEPLTLFIITE